MLLFLCIWFVLAISIGMFFIKLLKKAVIFSKVTFSLLVALIVNTEIPLLQDGGLVSYLIWAVIIGGGIFLLCLMPRVNLAFKFSCTACISYICFMLITSIITDLFEINIVPQETLDIVTKIAVLAVAGKALLDESGITNLNLFDNPILINLERLVASVMYGFTVVIIILNSTTYFTENVENIILISAIVLAFIVDIILSKTTKYRFNS